MVRRATRIHRLRGSLDTGGRNKRLRLGVEAVTVVASRNRMLRLDIIRVNVVRQLAIRVRDAIRPNNHVWRRPTTAVLRSVIGVMLPLRGLATGNTGWSISRHWRAIGRVSPGWGMLGVLVIMLVMYHSHAI